MAHPPNLLRRISFNLTLSSAIAFIFVSYLASSEPFTSMGRLADWVGETIGHSGRDWFLVFFAGFLVPIVLVVGSLPSRLTNSSTFAWFCAIVGFLSVPACYWVYRTPGQIADFLVLFASALMLFSIAMQANAKWPTQRWSLLVQVIMYFGFFILLFGRYMPLTVLIGIPLFALSTCLIWAFDVPIRSSTVGSE